MATDHRTYIELNIHNEKTHKSFRYYADCVDCTDGVRPHFHVSRDDAVADAKRHGTLIPHKAAMAIRKKRIDDQLAQVELS